MLSYSLIKLLSVGDTFTDNLSVVSDKPQNRKKTTDKA